MNHYIEEDAVEFLEQTLDGKVSYHEGGWLFAGRDSTYFWFSGKDLHRLVELLNDNEETAYEIWDKEVFS